MGINKTEDFDDLIQSHAQKKMPTGHDVKASSYVDTNMSREPLVGGSTDMDVSTSRDKDVVMSSEPYMDTSTEMNNNRSTAEDVQTSRERHRPTVRKKGKMSTYGGVNRSRLIDSGGDFERKPYNITIRCEYFKRLRILAAEQSTEVFLILDKAIGDFLRKELKNSRE